MGDHFRDLWGKEAGWAHSVLFTADLKAFSTRLTSKVEIVTVKKEGDSDERIGGTRIKSEVITSGVLKRELEEEDPIKTPAEEMAGTATAQKRGRWR